MTSSGLPSDDRSERPFAEPGEAKSPPGDDDLMEQVLAETLAAAADRSRLDPRETAALRGVARRYAGRPIEREPMLIELVQTVLSIRLPRLDDGSARWREMTAKIAETLWEDSAARQRLESLWLRLNEGEAG